LADEQRLNQLLISGLGDPDAFQSETESLLAAAENDKNRPLILQRLIVIFGEIPDVLFLPETGKEQVVSFLKALMSKTINIL
ncbi:hypothetical protein Q4S20_19915, partial [Morganella morganii]